MALGRESELVDPTPAMRARRDDRLTGDHPFDGDAGHSNFAAFVLGGVVIAGGMLGFLYYDSGATDRGYGLTTGSLAPVERRETASPSIMVQPRP